jgi:hypothetical protein
MREIPQAATICCLLSIYLRSLGTDLWIKAVGLSATIWLAKIRHMERETTAITMTTNVGVAKIRQPTTTKMAW